MVLVPCHPVFYFLRLLPSARARRIPADPRFTYRAKTIVSTILSPRFLAGIHTVKGYGKWKPQIQRRFERLQQGGCRKHDGVHPDRPSQPNLGAGVWEHFRNSLWSRSEGPQVNSMNHLTMGALALFAPCCPGQILQPLFTRNLSLDGEGKKRRSPSRRS